MNLLVEELDFKREIGFVEEADWSYDYFAGALTEAGKAKAAGICGT
jgi:hypothetical protein